MTTPQPDHQRRTGHWLDEGAAMDTFTVRSPRWLVVRLFGRNPLIRISDRIEALALVLTVVVSLLAAPIAAAVGTAVYDSRSRPLRRASSDPDHGHCDSHRQPRSKRYDHGACPMVCCRSRTHRRGQGATDSETWRFD